MQGICQCLVIAYSMAVWASREEGETRKKPSADSFLFKPSVSTTAEYLIGQYMPDDR